MNDVGGIGADRLRSFVERIERLEEEKAALTADIRDYPVGHKCRLIVEGDIVEQKALPEKPAYDWDEQYETRLQPTKVSKAVSDGPKAADTSRAVPRKTPAPKPYQR